MGLKSLSQSSKMPRAKRGKAKEALKKSKKNGNAVVELDGSDDDVNGNVDSDVSEVNDSSAGLTTETRAKKDVLEDSDESNDDDSPVKKKGRQAKQSKEEKNGSEKKSSSKKKSPDGGEKKFMRVKLDASDSSDNEEKATKRKDKIEAERENKKKKKAA